MPEPGQLYRHFKGGLYEVVAVARDCDDPGRMVVCYKSNLSGDHWVRGLDEWNEVLSSGELRFAKLEEDLRSEDASCLG